MYNLNGITNETLGAIVRKNIEAHQAYVEQQTPIWKEEGKDLWNRRIARGITQQTMSERIGVCTQTISKLENGKSVRSRKLMQHAYGMALDLV